MSEGLNPKVLVEHFSFFLSFFLSFSCIAPAPAVAAVVTAALALAMETVRPMVANRLEPP
jgi:hypothetical protein